MTDTLQLGFQRIGKTVVLVADDTMLKNNQGQLRETFRQAGFYLVTMQTDNAAFKSELYSVHLENSPALATIDEAQVGDVQVSLPARMLTMLKKNDREVLMTMIKEVPEVFAPSLQFHSGQGFFTNEHSHSEIWKVVAKTHGASKTWSAYVGIYVAYIRYCNNKKGLWNYFKDISLAMQIIKHHPVIQNVKKAIFSVK